MKYNIRSWLGDSGLLGHLKIRKFGSRIALAPAMSFASGREMRESNGPTDSSYPIGADVEYRVMQRNEVLASGTGRTRAISSSRVMFECEPGLRAGLLVELAVRWPVKLENGVGMTLNIIGRTVSATGNCTAVDILRHEFRTEAPPSPGKNAEGSSAAPIERSSTACAS